MCIYTPGGAKQYILKSAATLANYLYSASIESALFIFFTQVDIKANKTSVYLLNTGLPLHPLWLCPITAVIV